VAQEFDNMKIAFGDTAASFSQYVRSMKTWKQLSTSTNT
jgi:hypothetical protein